MPLRCSWIWTRLRFFRRISARCTQPALPNNISYNNSNNNNNIINTNTSLNNINDHSNTKHNN